MRRRRGGAYAAWILGSLGLFFGAGLIVWSYYTVNGFDLSGNQFWYAVAGFVLFVIGAVGVIYGAAEDYP